MPDITSGRINFMIALSLKISMGGFVGRFKVHYIQKQRTSDNCLNNLSTSVSLLTNAIPPVPHHLSPSSLPSPHPHSTTDWNHLLGLRETPNIPRDTHRRMRRTNIFFGGYGYPRHGKCVPVLMRKLSDLVFPSVLLSLLWIEYLAPLIMKVRDSHIRFNVYEFSTLV